MPEKRYSIFGLIGLGLAGAVTKLVGIGYPPLGREADVWQNKSWSNVRIDPVQILTARFRGLIDKDKFYELMKEHGYNEERSDQFYATGTWLPAVPDAIRWAVREAFKEEYVKEFGLDLEYPEVLTEYAIKGGISSEADNLKTVTSGTLESPAAITAPREAIYAWRSHWELPSISMGYAMFHRGLIKRSELDALFRAADVMPFWRDKLLGISFDVVSRIDVRRIYAMGIYTIEEVLDTYKKMGYSWYCPICGDELKTYPSYCEKDKKWTDAGALTEYVRLEDEEAKKGKTSTERDLTKAEIIKGVKIGQLSEQDGIDSLMSLGYDEDESDFLISLSQYEEESTKRELSATLVTNLYRYGIIDKDEARIEMRAIGYEGKAADYQLELIDFKKLYETKPLPYEMLRGMYYLDFFDRDLYLERLIGLGYMPTDAEMIIIYDDMRKPVKKK